MITQDTPTGEAYSRLMEAFDHFNRELFADELPAVMFIFDTHPRRWGHFANDRWHAGENEDHAHEIMMNPALMREYGFQESMQTLVHEMCHLWQQEHGKPSRNGYHNKEWGRKMEAVGLMPSSTGQPGGKKTGQKVADYAIEDGPFLESLARLEETGFKIRWGAVLPLKEASESEKPKSKVKFTCPECGQNAWAKPTASIACGECHVALESEDADE